MTADESGPEVSDAAYKAAKDAWNACPGFADDALRAALAAAQPLLCHEAWVYVTRVKGLTDRLKAAEALIATNPTYCEGCDTHHAWKHQGTSNRS